MRRPFLQTILITFLTFGAVWLGIRYLLPVAFPFLLGGGLALGAEPLVNFCQKKLRLPRFAATFIGVSGALFLVAAVLLLLAALIVRELGILSGVIPDLTDAARQGLFLLEGWLMDAAQRAPSGLQPVLTQGVRELFSGGSAFLDRVTGWLLSLASGILAMIPDGALGLGTTILSAYMICGKLPRIRQWVQRSLPQVWRSRYLPVLAGLRSALAGWLRAQLKLAGMTFLITTGGFLLLRVSHGPLWALVVALVDAVPLLGSGTVLIPWSIVCLLRGDQVRALGLIATYIAAALTRSVLEPRLVGKQLGLDPLLTLAALYAGYRFWGVGGMILSPIIAVTVTQLARLKEG